MIETFLMNMRLFSLFAGLMLFSGTTFTSWSQSSTIADTTALQPAAVTGGFAKLSPQKTPRAIVVVGTEEVAQTAASSLSDVLETVPGVDVRSRGPFGIQSDVSLRGGTFNQTALWIDGIRWSAPHTDHHCSTFRWIPKTSPGSRSCAGERPAPWERAR